MAQVTLKEYSVIKESTIDDIIHYANGKGLNIPHDPKYVLDEGVS